MTLHKYGIEHNEFIEGNVVVDNVDKPTRITVIDFDASVPHECEFSMKFHAFAMQRGIQYCTELWHTAIGLDLLTPGTYTARPVLYALLMISLCLQLV